MEVYGSVILWGHLLHSFGDYMFVCVVSCRLHLVLAGSDHNVPLTIIGTATHQYAVGDSLNTGVGSPRDLDLGACANGDG